MRFSVFRFSMDYGFSRAVNMIQQCKAPFPENDFCERLSNKVIFSFVGQSAEGGIDVEQCVIGPCQCCNRQGRALKEHPSGRSHIVRRIKAKVGIDFRTVRCFLRLYS